MRIAHVLKHSVRGAGNVHVAVDLACAQAAAGHEVTLISARGSYDDLLRHNGVQVVRVPEPLDRGSALRSGWALTRVLGNDRPDVVHAHMMSSAVLAFPAARAVGSALVTTVHNSFDDHSRLMRLGTVIVAVSQAERELLIARGFPAGKVAVVINGADRSAREELPLDDIGPLHQPALLTLSGLHRRKAVGDVIQAFSRLAVDLPDWHLNVVGWGADRERLETMVSDLGLAERVHFLGSTLTPRPLLESAAIFATASLADPCPLTVIEARAAGCAIVGTRVGGIPELLDHGRAGQLVPPSDPVAFAEALRPLMSDRAVLQEWRSRARRGAEYFTVDRMSTDYLAVYESVLTRRARRRARTAGVVADAQVQR